MIDLVCRLIAKYMAVMVLSVAVIAFVFPSSFSWIPPKAINYMLGAVMFGMGLTLKLSDFKIVFSRPKDVVIGCLAQFIVMPSIAWLLTMIFKLPPELAIGVILVGCCPGGTASNVITYLAKGDLALSVGMTCVSTVVAPLLTPFLTWFIADASINVDVVSMFWSIVQVVILPISLGFIIRHYFNRQADNASKYLPAFSSIVIALIVGSVVASNAEHLRNAGLIVILIVALHNICGFSLGYMLSRILNLSHAKGVAISVEVGMQNSGLACTLAQTHFATMPLSAVPGAIFSVWHNIAGAIFARLVNRE